MALDHRLALDGEEVVEVAPLVLVALVQLLLFQSLDGLRTNMCIAFIIW